MFCFRCGARLTADDAAFCGACGAATRAVAQLPDQLKRPGIVTILSILQFVFALIWLLTAVAIAVAAIGSEGSVGSGALLGALALGAMGVLQVICGIGLWKLKSYGRTLQLVFAFIGLLAIPVGTIISVLILVYLFKPGVRVLFSGKAVTEFTPAERADVASVMQSSDAVTVLIVVGVGIGSVFLIGIIAAIAVPGLLRARMSGNEAAAIGSLRAINSAQQSFAASAGGGGYATSLAALSATCPGAPESFLPPDLARDPSLKSGFTISLSSAGAAAGPADCNGVPTETNYYATAVPVTVGTTGVRAFATSAAATIFYDEAGRAPTLAETLAGTAKAIK